MKLIDEVLKETTEQNYTLDIYISECKHDETTPIEWVKEKTHKFQVVFHFNNVPNPNYGFSYYIDTIMDSYWGNTGGLCLYGHKYDYASVSEEVMDRVRAFIQRFVDANNINLSCTFTFDEEIIVVVPFTVKSPVTVIPPPTDTPPVNVAVSDA